MKSLRYLILIWHIGRQMGRRYVLFRAGYWLQGKTGILKLRFPRKATSRTFISKWEWLECKPRFLFDPQNMDLARNPALTDLQWRARQIRAGKFRYFSSRWFQISGWHTHPLTGYRYPVHEHWSQVNDFPVAAGDIKYVWEKSRFTFLYDLIRYDYHFKQDQSGCVFRLITDWIDSNPVNCGPNWKCSQEVALRVLNWTFALHYYRRSGTLTEALLNKILCSIYDQVHHVAANIRFAEVALRNNHLLTEALGLFVTGLLFRCFPTSQQWKSRGKYLFEREIVAQTAPDGTYLQFSMNYHRVVVQLTTWYIRLAELHNDVIGEHVYARARAALTFLRTCQSDENGHLPNYGHNDGALFFPLSESDFRDFRPQMSSLASMLGVDLNYQKGSWVEELQWLTSNAKACGMPTVKMEIQPISAFENGGYYIIREGDTITFLRCGKYDRRPFQADNNHLDIWINGRNILRDAGTWLYNADKESVSYFSGTKGHNTLMIGDFDQMQKQQRFTWTHWITKARGASASLGDGYWIEAEFEGFRHVGEGIIHKRKVIKRASKLRWVIEDYVQNVPKGMAIRQLWHPDKSFSNDFRMSATDEYGNEIPLIVESGWYSKVYGERVKCEVLVFETFGDYVRTVIERY